MRNEAEAGRGDLAYRTRAWRDELCPDGAHEGIALECPEQRIQPTGQHDRVVVEEEDEFASSRGRALVTRPNKPHIGLVPDQTETGNAGQHLPRRFVGPVVDDNDLVVPSRSL